MLNDKDKEKIKIFEITEITANPIKEDVKENKEILSTKNNTKE